MSLADIALEASSIAKKAGWTIKETRMARTGSIYIEIARKSSVSSEYVVIRVANHKQVYQRYLPVISIADGDRWLEELEEILTQPYGDVGEIL